MDIEINNCKNNSTIFNAKDWIEYTKDIEEMLNRQTPRIALETQELMEVTYICPNCNRLNGYGFNYCFYCGQAIITREDYW